MPPAIIGGAIAAVGGVASAVIGSNGAKSAAQANQSAADAAAAEQRAAREQAYNTLQPYIQAGQPATQQINALLGLSSDTGYEQYLPQRQPDMASYEPNYYGGEYGGFWQNAFAPQQPAYTEAEIAAAKQQAMQANQQRAQQGFDTFRNSTGYDFRVRQGMNALNSGYAGAGTIKSGAAIKGAIDYGQGMASQEFGNYLNALGNQQSLGLQAGGAAAGVGVQTGNSLGSIYMQNGANQANASLARASALGSGLSSLANFGGSILAGNGNSLGRLVPSVTSAFNANSGIF